MNFRDAPRRAVIATVAAALAATAAVGVQNHEPHLPSAAQQPSDAPSFTEPLPAAISVPSPDAAAAQLVGANADEGRTTGPVRTSARKSTRGYAVYRSVIGITPGGYTYYVDPKAAHRKILVRYARAAIKSMRKAGLVVAYGGLRNPKARQGVVKISETKGGCRSGGVRGLTNTRFAKLANGRKFVYDARVRICPKLFKAPMWAQSAIVYHELGHSVGLNHFNGTYNNTTQVMRAVTKNHVANYRRGDRNGLRFLGGNTTKIRSFVPAFGKYEKAKFKNDKVRLSGWAVLSYFKSARVKIVVKDNGKKITTTRTNVVRSDVNAAHDRGTRNRHGFDVSVKRTGGVNHKYCLTAVSPRNSAAAVSLGCATFKFK